MSTTRTLGDEPIDWMLSRTTEPEKKHRRTRATAPIDNKIFGEAANVSLDPEWKELLKNAQDGVFPTRFSYNDNDCALSYKVGQNITRQYVRSINPVEVATIFQSFLRENGGIYSEIDQRNIQLQNLNTEDNPARNSWTQMKKKFQPIAMGKFISVEAGLRKLSLSEKNQLTNIVDVGITLGYFSKDNIIVQDFDVVGINGLFYNETIRKYEIDPTLKPKPKRATAARKTSTKKPVTYGEKWTYFHTSQFSRKTVPVIIEEARENTGDRVRNVIIEVNYLECPGGNVIVSMDPEDGEKEDSWKSIT